MKKLYLVIAIVGAAAPYFFFLDYFANNGFNLGGFVLDLFANSPATGFAVDLLVSSVVFWLFMFNDKKNNSVNSYPFIAINLLVGLSCALPAYLYARTGK